MRRCLAAVLAATFVAVAALPAGASVVPSRRAHVAAWNQGLGHEVGRLVIPAIGVDELIREGVAMSVIDRGVAHWAGTAMPGGHGNMVLAGHRTTHTRPFYRLNELDPGDEIVVTGLEGQRTVYVVTERLIVSPRDIWIADWTATPTVTLFACHPRGSARQRIVVRAELAFSPLSLP